MKIQGYAAVFNSLSADLGGFREQIMPGAFTRTLTGGTEVLAFHHHDYSQVLGRTGNGSLHLSENSRGLHFTLELPDTTLGRDTYALVNRRDLGAMSFGFAVPNSKGESWKETDKGLIRSLHAVNLLEISTTSIPAYPATVVKGALAPKTNHARSLRRRMKARQLDSIAAHLQAA
ncbi:HK97 family phage prohead protease [Natronospira bacteriovora]|uniref:HK97 family phage prohead protease n=1 Tax=Natronospira bacteriovora TaxID=3069753 RepID=A0ABU0W5A2_9GAMM|nr:HK97 family phage prohead protease [Natronospira sp. AB-CW4]MDQ2069202.1 HK97 family phage prohead protease [Natronospira sp. AB-CW4]